MTSYVTLFRYTDSQIKIKIIFVKNVGLILDTVYSNNSFLAVQVIGMRKTKQLLSQNVTPQLLHHS